MWIELLYIWYIGLSCICLLIMFIVCFSKFCYIVVKVVIDEICVIIMKIRWIGIFVNILNRNIFIVNLENKICERYFFCFYLVL